MEHSFLYCDICNIQTHSGNTSILIFVRTSNINSTLDWFTQWTYIGVLCVCVCVVFRGAIAFPSHGSKTLVQQTAKRDSSEECICTWVATLTSNSRNQGTISTLWKCQ